MEEKESEFMRVIKFRGKSSHSDEWCFGSLVDYGDGEMEIQGFDVFREGVDEWKEMSVDPDTVGQFTGLHDANGKEIYDGDILGASDRVIGYVEGDVRGYCYDVVYINHPAGEKRWPLYATVANDFPGKIKVVGNVFDNVELLEGGGK